MENNNNRGVIALKARELMIKTLDTGEKVVQIKGNTAFDKGFIEECELAGVQEWEDNRDKE